MTKHEARYPNALRACIKEAGYSFREVSQETNIPERTLYDWATGNRPIPKRERQVLADLLGYPVEALAPQRPAHRMVQLLQDQAALPASSYVPAASGVLVPPSDVQQDAAVDTELLDWPTWFGQQLTNLTSLIASWQAEGVSCQQLQALVHTELERWNTMAHQSDGNSREVLMSRRTALAALAILSTALVAKVQTGPLTAVLMEDFLTQCTASITSCWHLLNGDGLVTVEYALPRYLLLLVALARQSSPYQKTAAHLAAQASLLMNLVSFHRLRFREALAYAKQAVELARMSEDRNLYIYALTFLGGALGRNGQPEAMLQKRQEAEQHLNKEVVLPLRSQVLADLAYAYAQNGQIQDALRCMGEARNLFPSEFGAVPFFVSANYGLYHLILFEGMTHLALGESDAAHIREHSQHAMSALVQFGQLPSTIIVPERYKIQIINEQAAAAVGIRNMEKFEYYLLAGVEGAKALGSQKRRQEAIANWKAARKAWPHEEKILKLAAVLMEQ